jgi:hypothetical protein
MYGRVPPRPAAIFSSQVDAAMVGSLSAAPPRISHRCAVVGFIFAGRERHSGHWLHPDEMVSHALDAGDVFSGDDQARTFSIISNHAMQFSHTPADDQISIADAVSNAVRVRDTVSMVNPR